MSSQAYVEKFQNRPIEPDPRTIDYDTSTYEAQYHWLGFHARRLVFDFVAEAVDDLELSLDVFAYDLNEPDFIRQLARLGPGCGSTSTTRPSTSSRRRASWLRRRC